MQKTLRETAPLRAKRLSVAQIDASIERLKEAYRVYLAGEEADAEVSRANRRRVRLSDAEVAEWMKMPVKDLPDEPVDYHRLLMDFERQMEMKRALWENHGCGQHPDCGHPILIFCCQRYGFCFDFFGTFSDGVEDVLGHLYKLRLASEAPDSPGSSKRVQNIRYSNNQ